MNNLIEALNKAGIDCKESDLIKLFLIVKQLLEKVDS